MAATLSGILCLLSSGFAPQSPRYVTNELKPVWWNPVRSSPPQGNFEIYQGDILVTKHEDLRNAIKNKAYLWKDGIIPYELGDNFTASEEKTIIEAMFTLENKTCIKFIKNDGQETFINFKKEKKGCFAPIGRLPGNKGSLPINLQSPECFAQRGIVEHELLHVVGLFHEHARSDRDKYVDIHWCNIMPDQGVDFLKGSDRDIDSFDLPYDYKSIMHYPRWAFSKNGQPTITAKENPDMTLGQRNRPTEIDLKKVKKIYKCKDRV